MKLEYCCTGFDHILHNNGQAGVGIYVIDHLDQPGFFLQFRSLPKGEVLPKFSRDTDNKIRDGDKSTAAIIATETPFSYCPWCGTSLKKHYKKSWKLLAEITASLDFASDYK